MNLGKILLSASMIAFVGAAAFTGTGAFFSDTETSTGNTFTAGEIDLTVDSVAHYNGLVCFDEEWVPEDAVVWNPQTEMLEDDGDEDTLQEEIDTFNTDNPENFPQAGTECGGTWSLTDLGPTHQFFNYGDLKPGDNGENTLSLHLATNDGYACAIINNLVDNDNGLTEPEEDDGDTTGGDGEGELSSELRFFAWEDDGDNIWEDEEQVLFSNTEGPASDVIGGVSYPLFTPETGAMTASSTVYVGLYWCYGDIEVNEEANTLSCDGAPVSNVTQTDSMTADISFYVEQSRNNPNFTCPDPEGFEGDNHGAGRPVGAVLAEYVAPTCDVTVNGTIQAAVDGAPDNATVCVPDGSYNETVVINHPLTLASINGPTNTAIIEGGVQIDSSDVTVTGFVINPGDVPSDPGDVGVFLNGSLSNVRVTYNDIDGTGGGTTRGILTTLGSTYSNVFIENNVIHDLTTGIYTNPMVGVGPFYIRFNDIDDNVAGIGGLNGAIVVANEFESSSGSSEAIGIDDSFDLNPTTSLTQNNFLDDTRLNTYGSITTTIDAENNFFNNGGLAQVSEVGGTVDYDPEALGAFPHN